MDWYVQPFSLHTAMGTNCLIFGNGEIVFKESRVREKKGVYIPILSHKHEHKHQPHAASNISYLHSTFSNHIPSPHNTRLHVYVDTGFWYMRGDKDEKDTKQPTTPF
jgi:hypothetical protein